MRRYISLAAAVIAAFSSSVARAQAPAASAMVSAPDVGQMAPDFTAPWGDAAGPKSAPVKLSDLRGKVVVLAFYPKDRTGGCTAELSKFRDESDKLFGPNVVVLPISADSVSSHVSWCGDMKFPFALVSDPSLSIAESYGSRMPGRNMANRTIFVIGKDGKVVWRDMKFNALAEDGYTAMAAAIAKAK